MSFFIGNCPICHQGMQEILKECSTRKIYICCDECEAEWLNPEDTLINNHTSRFNFGISVSATIEEIEKKGWKKYIVFSDINTNDEPWTLETPEE